MHVTREGWAAGPPALAVAALGASALGTSTLDIVGVLFVDLDRFKEVNDTFGHAAGDLLLQTVAERLRGCVRDEDTVSRLSRDEFVVLLPHLTAAHEVLVVAQRVLDAFVRPITVAEEHMLVAASIGVAVFPDDGTTAEEVLASADAAMYQASTITAALRASGADPQDLVIELTESTVLDNLDAVAATLEELRAIGVRAAIDDFGTGYCGLRYLSTLPVASLKIDRSFIQGMTPSDAAIVGATIAMGHSLGLTLVAEGVETDEQRRFLAGQRCDRLQGFLLGRPMPATDLVDRLRIERAAGAPQVDEPAAPRTVAAPDAPVEAFPAFTARGPRAAGVKARWCRGPDQRAGGRSQTRAASRPRAGPRARGPC